MKTTIKSFGTAIIAFFLLITACEGPQGEPGPAGKDGTNGTNGVNGKDGNANVIQISFTSRSFANTVGSLLTLSLSGVDADLAKKSAYFTYVNTNGFWYSVPGQISIIGEFRTYLEALPTSKLTITRVTTGSILNADAIRVILIPANDLRSGRKVNLDFTDYNEVKKFYHLPD